GTGQGSCPVPTLTVFELAAHLGAPFHPIQHADAHRKTDEAEDHRLTSVEAGVCGRNEIVDRVCPLAKVDLCRGLRHRSRQRDTQRYQFTDSINCLFLSLTLDAPRSTEQGVTRQKFYGRAPGRPR